MDIHTHTHTHTHTLSLSLSHTHTHTLSHTHTRTYTHMHTRAHTHTHSHTHTHTHSRTHTHLTRLRLTTALRVRWTSSLDVWSFISIFQLFCHPVNGVLARTCTERQRRPPGALQQNKSHKHPWKHAWSLNLQADTPLNKWIWWSCHYGSTFQPHKKTKNINS